VEGLLLARRAVWGRVYSLVGNALLLRTPP
jgi:hypothetical protein